MSDGASVPSILWRMVFPPSDPSVLRGAFCHDYIYEMHPDGWTREEADKMFRDVLIHDGVKPWKANLAYYGVRIFGGKHWNMQGA
jgi:hypothetical protein